MLSECEQPGCGKLVDVDPWFAWPDKFKRVPHLCRTHLNERFDYNKERGFFPKAESADVMEKNDG
jgi:hypothetical protein